MSLSYCPAPTLKLTAEVYGRSTGRTCLASTPHAWASSKENIGRHLGAPQPQREEAPHQNRGPDDSTTGLHS
jgi:hypothetical protein